MRLNQTIWSILALLLIVPSIIAQESADAPQENEKRLDVSSKQSESSLINIEGFVKARNKYSIDVDTGTSTYPVKLGKDAAVKLRVVSPRIDFEEKQLIIDVQGAEKRYRGYAIPVPLFARINFVHQKQQQRVTQQPVKRLSDFELFAQRPAVPAAKKLTWVGELKPGESKRQLKFELDSSKVYDVLLAKRGSMGGFKISDLKAGITGVRVSGKLNDDGVVIAKEILFWPAAGYKKTAKAQ